MDCALSRDSWLQTANKRPNDTGWDRSLCRSVPKPGRTTCESCRILNLIYPPNPPHMRRMSNSNRGHSPPRKIREGEGCGRATVRKCVHSNRGGLWIKSLHLPGQHFGLKSFLGVLNPHAKAQLFFWWGRSRTTCCCTSWQDTVFPSQSHSHPWVLPRTSEHTPSHWNEGHDGGVTAWKPGILWSTTSDQWGRVLLSRQGVGKRMVRRNSVQDTWNSKKEQEFQVQNKSGPAVSPFSIRDLHQAYNFWNELSWSWPCCGVRPWCNSGNLTGLPVTPGKRPTWNLNMDLTGRRLFLSNPTWFSGSM